MKPAETAIGAWHGRFLLALGATAFLVVPMFVGRLAENARIGLWEDRGFGPDEPRQWWSQDISSRSEALEWRANGFAPEGAGAWRRMEFIAADAKEWAEGGFNVRAAADWRREAFDPAAAAEWKNAGFSIGDAVAWRKRAFGPRDAARWKQAGLSPLDAVAQRADGGRRERR